MMRYCTLLLFLVLLSCDSTRVYEDYDDMHEAFWHLDSLKKFSFDITDIDREYNLLATFRNSSSYPFYNIYFQYSLTDNQDSVIIQQLKEADLFDPKTGQPYGSGLGDMFDHSVPLLENFKFSEAGTYSLSLQQQMRLDSLPFVLSVGARVEFVKE